MKPAIHLTIAIVGLASALVLFEVLAYDAASDVDTTQPITRHSADAKNSHSVGDKSTLAQISESEKILLAHTSLADTAVPGIITLDNEGALIIDHHSKAVMDYFLSLSGEMSDIAIRQMVFAWAQQTADEQAAQQFITLFDNYRDYVRAIASGEFTATGTNVIRQNLAHRQRLRQEIFGAGVAAEFFAEEDDYDLFSAARLEIMQSASDTADKQAAIRDLYHTLPERIAQQYEQQFQLEQLRETEQSLRGQGGTDADIYAHRQQQFGDMAAVRLQALDETRQQWHDRVSDYRKAKEQILAATLTPEDQQAQIDALRQDRFSEPEQLRIAALDRMALRSD